MLQFLWHMRGSVPLEGVGAAAAIEHVEALLERQRKPVSARGPDSIAFDAPLWRGVGGRSWAAMAMYDRGSFRVEHDLAGPVLRYDLRSLHGFVFCLLAACTAFLLALRDGVASALLIACVAMAWLYGMNRLIAWARVPRLIRKTVRGA